MQQRNNKSFPRTGGVCPDFNPIFCMYINSFMSIKKKCLELKYKPGCLLISQSQWSFMKRDTSVLQSQQNVGQFFRYECEI